MDAIGLHSVCNAAWNCLEKLDKNFAGVLSWTFSLL